jgi:hypothetical protein
MKKNKKQEAGKFVTYVSFYKNYVKRILCKMQILPYEKTDT